MGHGGRRPNSGGARPGGGRKPKPTNPLQWNGLWERIDSELAPMALDKLIKLVEAGDKEAIFYSLKVAGLQRTYQDALAAAAEKDQARTGGGLRVTFTPATNEGGSSISISMPPQGSAASSPPSSKKG